MLQKDGIYAMYLRKSRADIEAECRGQFETLSHHLQILTDLADQHGIRVHRIYKEIVSGDSIANRPEVQKLLEEVAAGVYDGVLVTEVSRLARGRTKDQGTVAEAFRDSGTLIITPSKIYDPADDADETFFDFELFMARQEYKYIRKRMQRGRELSFQNGNWIFPHVPIGYKKDGLRLVPGDDADVMRAVLQDFASGSRNLTDTIFYLRSVIPDRKWATGSVRRTLTNPIYAGYMRHGKDVPNAAADVDIDQYIRANCVPLITLDEHLAAIRRIAPRPRVRNGLPIRNAFAGLIRCKACGHAIVYNANHGHPVLTHQHGADIPSCTCYPVRYDQAYKDIMDAIISRLPSVEYETDTEDVTAQIEDLQRRLKRAEDIKRDLFDNLENGLYTASEFKERKMIRDAEINALKGHIRALQGHMKKAPVKVSTDDLADALRSDDAQMVNELLKTFVSHIEYKKDSRQAVPLYEVYFL